MSLSSPVSLWVPVIMLLLSVTTFFISVFSPFILHDRETATHLAKLETRIDGLCIRVDEISTHLSKFEDKLAIPWQLILPPLTQDRSKK